MGVITFPCTVRWLSAVTPVTVTDIDGSTQDCENSIASALELPQSCAMPSIWYSPFGAISIQYLPAGVADDNAFWRVVDFTDRDLFIHQPQANPSRGFHEDSVLHQLSTGALAHARDSSMYLLHESLAKQIICHLEKWCLHIEVNRKRHQIWKNGVAPRATKKTQAPTESISQFFFTEA